MCKINFITKFIILFLMKTDSSEQAQQTTFERFTPAYSYLLAKGQKVSVCFDDRMSLVKKTRASVLKGCIVQCLALTGRKLRGVNYIPSDGSCVCIPKTNGLLNVSTELVTAAGCRGYVNHDCPTNFDYVIEYHKCYKMQYTLQTWSIGRSLCNNISSSHPITIDDLLENNISIQYGIFTCIAQCPVAGMKNAFGFFTSGFQTFLKGVRSFSWSPYPGVSKPVQIEASVWHPKEPSSKNDGIDYCIQSIFYGYFGWDDKMCNYTECVLCEIDMST